MPRAIISDTLGPPESYRIEPFDPAPLQPDEVRMAIKAIGISYVDVLMAAGQYQVKPPTPFIPGSECAGVIEAVGENVSDFAVGQRVQAGNWGRLFADSVTLHQGQVSAIPDSLSFEAAAVFSVSYATAWYALVQRGAVQAGETVLVLGAGGATGYAAVQVAKHLGARVIASASSEEKRALALAGGANIAVDARSETWRDDVKAANDGKGVDVVFDPVGGDATDPAFRSLGWNGRHLIIGFPGGIAAVKTNLPLLKGASLIGVDLRQFGLFEPKIAEANRQLILALAGQGKLLPAIARSYPFESYVEAMQDVASGQSAGRILLVNS